MGIEELKGLYAKHFSLDYLGKDISNKFALISLICYLRYALSKNSQFVTHSQIIDKVIGDKLPVDRKQSLAVICNDLSYGCNEFPTFGIEPKKMPEKIREILKDYVPF